MKTRFYMLLLLPMLMVGCAATGGSTTPPSLVVPADILQQSTDAVNKANGVIAGLQADIGLLQAQLKVTESQLASEKAVLTTRPGDVQAEKAVTSLDKQAVDAQTKLDAANVLLGKVQVAVAPVLGALNSINSGQAVSPTAFSALGALGPWGLLAGALIPIGLNIYQAVSNEKLKSQLAGATPILQHLTEATGESNPYTAVSNLTARAVAGDALRNINPGLSQTATGTGKQMLGKLAAVSTPSTKTMIIKFQGDFSELDQQLKDREEKLAHPMRTSTSAEQSDKPQ